MAIDRPSLPSLLIIQSRYNSLQFYTTFDGGRGGGAPKINFIEDCASTCTHADAPQLVSDAIYSGSWKNKSHRRPCSDAAKNALKNSKKLQFLK
jgi:hypothetical protein